MFKNRSIKKAIALIVITCFLSQQVSWAAVKKDADLYTLAPEVLSAARPMSPENALRKTQLRHDVEVKAVLIKIADYLLGDPPRPFKGLKAAMGTWDMPALERLEIKKVVPFESVIEAVSIGREDIKVPDNMDPEGILLVLYKSTADGKLYPVLITRKYGASSAVMGGEDILLPSKEYTAKIMPESFRRAFRRYVALEPSDEVVSEDVLSARENFMPDDSIDTAITRTRPENEHDLKSGDIKHWALAFTASSLFLIAAGVIAKVFYNTANTYTLSVLGIMFAYSAFTEIIFWVTYLTIKEKMRAYIQDRLLSSVYSFDILWSKVVEILDESFLTNDERGDLLDMAYGIINNDEQSGDMTESVEKISSYFAERIPVAHGYAYRHPVFWEFDRQIRDLILVHEMCVRPGSFGLKSHVRGMLAMLPIAALINRLFLITPEVWFQSEFYQIWANPEDDPDNVDLDMFIDKDVLRIGEHHAINWDNVSRVLKDYDDPMKAAEAAIRALRQRVHDDLHIDISGKDILGDRGRTGVRRMVDMRPVITLLSRREAFRRFVDNAIDTEAFLSGTATGTKKVDIARNEPDGGEVNVAWTEISECLYVDEIESVYELVVDGNTAGLDEFMEERGARGREGVAITVEKMLKEGVAIPPSISTFFFEEELGSPGFRNTLLLMELMEDGEVEDMEDHLSENFGPEMEGVTYAIRGVISRGTMLAPAVLVFIFERGLGNGEQRGLLLDIMIDGGDIEGLRRVIRNGPDAVKNTVVSYLRRLSGKPAYPEVKDLLIEEGYGSAEDIATHVFALIEEFDLPGLRILLKSPSEDVRRITRDVIKRSTVGSDPKYRPVRDLLSGGTANGQTSPVSIEGLPEDGTLEAGSIFDAESIREGFGQRYINIQEAILNIGREILKVMPDEVPEGTGPEGLFAPLRSIEVRSQLGDSGVSSSVAAFDPETSLLEIDARIEDTNSDFISFNLAHEIFEGMMAVLYPDRPVFRELAAHVFSLRLFLASDEACKRNILSVLEGREEYSNVSGVGYAEHLRSISDMYDRAKAFGKEEHLARVLFIESARRMEEYGRYPLSGAVNMIPASSESAVRMERDIYGDFGVLLSEYVHVLAEDGDTVSVMIDEQDFEEVMEEVKAKEDAVERAVSMMMDGECRGLSEALPNGAATDSFEMILSMAPDVADDVKDRIREYYYAHLDDIAIVRDELVDRFGYLYSPEWDVLVISANTWDPSVNRSSVLAGLICCICREVLGAAVCGEAAESFDALSKRLRGGIAQPGSGDAEQRVHPEILQEINMMTSAVERISRISGVDLGDLDGALELLNADLSRENLGVFLEKLEAYRKRVFRAAVKDFKQNLNLSSPLSQATDERRDNDIFKAARRIRDRFVERWGAVFSDHATKKPEEVFYSENRVIDFVVEALINYVREDRYEFFREYYLDSIMDSWESGQELPEGVELSNGQREEGRDAFSGMIPGDVVSAVLSRALSEMKSGFSEEIVSHIREKTDHWVKAIFSTHPKQEYKDSLIGGFDSIHGRLAHDVLRDVFSVLHGREEGAVVPRAVRAVSAREDMPDIVSIVASATNNRKDELIASAAAFQAYLEIYGLDVPDDMSFDDVEGEPVIELKMRIYRLIKMAEGSHEIELPPQVKALKETLSKEFKDIESDSIVSSLIALADNAAMQGRDLVLGYETSWMPFYDEGVFQHNAMNELMDTVSSLGSILSSMGVENVKIVCREKGESVDAWSLRMIEACESKKDLSNLIMMGGKASISGFETHMSRLNIKNSKRAFAASIDPEAMLAGYEEDGNTFSNQIPVNFLEMLALTLELALERPDEIPDLSNIPFVVPGSYDRKKRRIDYLPDAEGMSYDDLIKHYEARNRALLAA